MKQTAAIHLSLPDAVFEKQDSGSPDLLKLLQRKAPIPAFRPAGDLWDEGFFGLDRVERFRRAEPERRSALIAALGNALLEEALRIERAGMVFTCRMSLMAETVEEQTLFNLFAAEEALHHRAISAFLPDGDAMGGEDGFARGLRDMAANGPRAALFLIVQVILEGWGLQHYRKLMTGCRSSELRKVFGAIIKDEAKHHQGGRVLVEATPFSPTDLEYALDRLRGFLGAVQAGPVRFLQECERALGPLGDSDRDRILAETDAAAAAQAKLDVLKRLCAEGGVDPVFRILEQEGRFRIPAGGLPKGSS